MFLALGALPKAGAARRAVLVALDLHRLGECGERNASILSLRLIARILRVPPVELFAETQRPGGAE